MKVILIQEIPDLGVEGDMVNVADGYARNYLIPKGFAIEATPQNIKLIEQRKKKLEIKKIKAKEEAEKIKEKLKDVFIKIQMKAGEEGKLYGAVTTRDIAEELEKKGIKIDRRKIDLKSPIKNLGEYDIPLKLHPEVTGTIRLSVISEIEA